MQFGFFEIFSVLKFVLRPLYERILFVNNSPSPKISFKISILSIEPITDTAGETTPFTSGSVTLSPIIHLKQAVSHGKIVIDRKSVV